MNNIQAKQLLIRVYGIDYSDEDIDELKLLSDEEFEALNNFVNGRSYNPKYLNIIDSYRRSD